MSWAVPFDVIYEPMRSYCRRLARNNVVEWEDLAQETYVAIMLDYSNDVRDILRWAKTVCYRIFASMMRAAKYRVYQNIDDYAGTLSIAPNQDDRVLCHQLAAKMPSEYATRHLVDDWDHAEIMSHYGATYKAVAQATHYARKKMREIAR